MYTDQKVINAALNWWYSKRPVRYDQNTHLTEATVNCSTVAEEALAKAVAAYIKKREGV